MKGREREKMNGKKRKARLQIHKERKERDERKKKNENKIHALPSAPEM